jgi:hypothetical protein
MAANREGGSRSKDPPPFLLDRLGVVPRRMSHRTFDWTDRFKRAATAKRSFPGNRPSTGASEMALFRLQ